MASLLASHAPFHGPTPAPDPTRVETLLSEAIAHLQAGRGAQALDVIGQVHRAETVGAVAATLLGLVAMSAGAHALALRWLDHALAVDPTFVEALKARATVLADCGRPAEAHAAFEAAFAAGCVDPVAHYHHGNALRTLGARDAAVAAYDRALRLKPDYPEALRAGGEMLRDGGNPEYALRFFSEALRLRPDFRDAVLDHANLLESLDRFDAALATLDAGLAHLPHDAQLHTNRGVALMGLGRLDVAYASYAQALQLDPTLAAAYLNRGEVEVRWGRFPEALASFEAALALRPAYAKALCAKGVALKLLARFGDAGEAFEAALRLDPTSVYALTNRGELKLLLGDFDGGWPDYDKRFATRAHDKPVLATPVPEWRGDDAPGRIAIFADQAAGDIIHFARYLPLVRAAGGDVTLICRPRLQRLLRRPSEGCRVVEAVAADAPFDHQIPLSSLPFACRTNAANMPNAAYLAAEDDLVALWRETLGAGVKIGLCWRGNQNWRSDPKRSVPLASLLPLSQVPGLRLISLQMADNVGPDTGSYAAMGLETLGDLDTGADGFVETAAVMANLDLVISCDTSIAHLAGALGRPTFVLLQKVPEWRFMMDRADSPWYPSMRLFRQTVQDDWRAPVAEMVYAVHRRFERSEAP